MRLSDRLISFLKSDKKQALLRYFYYELRGRASILAGSFLPGNRSTVVNPDGRINIAGQATRMYGSHRSGWGFAMKNLKGLDNPNGILLDAFIDRTFAADALSETVYTQPWIGFIHVPPGVPEWLQSKQSNAAIFSSERWKRSEPHCRGLFTLSQYHKQHLQPLFNFPVENLLHPVEFPQLTWSYERFAANRDKKIVQSGWWLRRVYSLYLLEVKGYRKILLQKQDADMQRHLELELQHMEERGRITEKALDSVTSVSFLSNSRYDQLLSENILFLDLYDASACNAIVECIARNTPVLVNPLGAVMEYLGRDYPFYFNSLEEAAAKAENMELVHETHRYLVNHPMREKLTGNYFRDSFIHSAIYQSL